MGRKESNQIKQKKKRQEACQVMTVIPIFYLILTQMILFFAHH